MPTSFVPHLVRVSLLLAVAISAAAQGAKEQAAKQPSGPPTWYAQALSRGDAGLNVTHLWSKGAALRAETVAAGHRIVTIVRGDRYYAYDALTGQGLSIRREPAVVDQDRADVRPFAQEYEVMLRHGAELVREETLLGRRAGIYRVTDDLGRRELWVTQDAQRIPLRIEIFDRKSGTNRITDYVNWQSGLDIPDAFFAPDSRSALAEMDYSEYLRRSAAEGSVGPVPVFYTHLLFRRKE